MDLITDYLKEFLEWLPKEVLLAVLIVVVITECTKRALKVLEEKLEAKKGKEIRFFDHTKIIFVTVWALVATVILGFAGVYTWTQAPMYGFTIFGAAVACYEYIVKKIGKLWE